MESPCLISLSLMWLVAVTLQKKWTRACATHPENCCSSVSFRNSIAYPPHFTHNHASSVRARQFAFVVCGSALWKLGHMQPEWLHHRRNSVKHLSLLPLLVPRKDLSAALAHIAHSLLLAAPPSITLLMSSLSLPVSFILNAHWGKFFVFANLDLFLVLCGCFSFRFKSDADYLILHCSWVKFTKWQIHHPHRWMNVSPVETVVPKNTQHWWLKISLPQLHCYYPLTWPWEAFCLS